MSTKVSDIKIIGDLEIEKRTASVEKIAKCFSGIQAIHFCNGTEKNFISVYTLNLGSDYIAELAAIQKSLKAQTLSISTIGTYYKAQGLVYVFGYKK